MKKSNMYPDTKTYNPFVGCWFDCVYCEKSFRRQLKRVARHIDCQDCYDYRPHRHPERLTRIPSAPNIFVCGTADISAEPSEVYVWNILGAISNHKPRMEKTYFFQSKFPKVFEKYLSWFNYHKDKALILTTLETNRDEGYRKISKAPLPSERFKQFYELDYTRKVVTIEPVLDFDLDEFSNMIFQLHDQGNLEYVWFGFDSKKCGLPEPSEEKAQAFVDRLQSYGIEVRGKTLRGVKLHSEGNVKDA